MGGNNFQSIRKVRQSLRKLEAVKTWQLLLIFILFAFASATLLRFEHLRMVRLRDAVLAADAEGDDATLAEKLTALQSFAANHIVVNVVDDNGLKKLEFGTGVFYLEQSYLRVASEALEAAAAQEIDDSNPNGNIYAAAMTVCRPLAIRYGWAWNSAEYVGCFTDELAKYPASALTDGTITVALPSTELYRREFASPLWAPSFAGFFLLATFLLGVVIFIRFLIWLILEITLTFLKNS